MYQKNNEAWWEQEWQGLYHMVKLMPAICQGSGDTSDRELKHACITATLGEVANDAREEVLRLRLQIEKMEAMILTLRSGR